jgi:SHS2 domain-containing protein
MKQATNAQLPYRELEHTGDLRIEITAPARSELFRRAILALADLLVEISDVTTTTSRTIEISAGDDIELMHDLLTELLQLYEADNFVWREATVEERSAGLLVVLRGESFDPKRHLPRGEIKAVTYHQMTVENTTNEWRARIIFDV